MTKREFVVTFDTEKDADILAFWDALPEPHKSRVFVLIMRARMYQEARDTIRGALGWPIEPGTKATAEQLAAIRAALDKAGLWLDVDGEVER